jgi:peptidoglycan/xylan/chitin deacetylase (PgdA/CDA1 family)
MSALQHIVLGRIDCKLIGQTSVRRVVWIVSVSILWRRLYHRVNDELRDSVTVGIEQFEQQMAYLARHYPIASIEDIIHGRLPSPALHKPIVVVTFDDGYYDNYANAVPALLKHNIPAAFFVSTGMIGEERGFLHDLEKLGRALPNMDWSHLRAMRDHGFTIGSHTVSHANCGQLSTEALNRELIEARDRLKAELGLKEIIFAYPFGQKSDISPEGVRLVREVGYAGCLSAYGGVNHEPVDSFNVLRMGVDYNFGPRRFAARVEGW